MRAVRTDKSPDKSGRKERAVRAENSRKSIFIENLNILNGFERTGKMINFVLLYGLWEKTQFNYNLNNYKNI